MHKAESSWSYNCAASSQLAANRDRWSLVLSPT